MAAVALLGRDAAGTGPPGAARIATVLLLAYAILRQQLLDIDLKVKWTIKQSTVAAAFIGVFFVVSNGVQTFFQGSFGPYRGIAAAGALVFAIAPLQRAAERVANAAMPGVKTTSEMSPDARLHLYREQARAAWSDGAISKDERLLLDRLRASLGVSHEDANRIESEAATEGDA